MQSLIPMANGSVVMRADLVTHVPSGDVYGIVLAKYHNQYVTWTVGRTVVTGPEFQAHNGSYFDNFTEAVRSYNYRRS